MGTYTLVLARRDLAAIEGAVTFHTQWQEEEGLDTDPAHAPHYRASVEARDALSDLLVGINTVTLSDQAVAEALEALTHHAEVFVGDGGTYEYDQHSAAFRAAIALGAKVSDLPEWHAEWDEEE